MKNVLIATIFTTLISSQAMATCSYLLDATASDYTTASETPFPTINTSLQEGSATILPRSGKSYSAFSHQFFNNYLQSGDASVPTTGIFAFENSIANFPTTTPQRGGVVNAGLSGVLSNANEAISFSIYVISGSVLSPNSSVEISIYNATTSQVITQSYPISLPIGTNFRTGLFVNQNTKQVGLIVNGVNKGYFSSIFQNPIQAIGFKPFSFFNSSINSSDPVSGATVTTRLTTDAANIVYTYPSGTKDICGNTI